MSPPSLSSSGKALLPGSLLRPKPQSVPGQQQVRGSDGGSPRGPAWAASAPERRSSLASLTLLPMDSGPSTTANHQHILWVHLLHLSLLSLSLVKATIISHLDYRRASSLVCQLPLCPNPRSTEGSLKNKSTPALSLQWLMHLGKNPNSSPPWKELAPARSLLAHCFSHPPHPSGPFHLQFLLPKQLLSKTLLPIAQ